MVIRLYSLSMSFPSLIISDPHLRKASQNSMLYANEASHQV